MKKIMAVIGCAIMGASAHAASYQWSCTSGRIFDGTGATTYSTSVGKTAYLMFTSDLSLEDAVSGFNSSASASAYEKTVSDKAIGKATLNSNARIDATDASSSTVTSAQTAYFVVFANDKMYVSSSVTAAYAEVGTSSVTFSSQSTPSKTTLDASAGYSSAGWYAASTSPVPEPTSAMLMLLGFCGLALRRRRA